MKKFVSLLVLLGTVLNGCIIIKQSSTLPSSPYVGTVPLTGQIIHSPEGDMIATIPQGWILLDTENKTDPNTVLVLADTSYSGIIVFEKMPATPELMADVKEDGIDAAIRKSFLRLKEKTHDAASLISSYQTFGVDDREFGSYEYSTDHRQSNNRVVLFSTGKQIYQCIAVQLSTDGKPMMSFHDLCASQQSIVNSIRW